MKCPYCGKSDSSVLESRANEDDRTIRRRRECLKCQKRFTTYERIEGIDLTVLKKDGAKEMFDRDKIRKGIMKATWKRPVSVEDIEELIEDIEQKLRRRQSNEIKSWEIGNMVMTRLRKLDPVSYLLFASVYRDFQDLNDFEQEVEKLKEDI